MFPSLAHAIMLLTKGTDLTVMSGSAASSTVSSFLKYYERFLESNSKQREQSSLSKIKDLLSGGAEWTYSGQPGLVSGSYGSFQGRKSIASALKALKSEVKTTSFQSQEIIDSAFSVDFTQPNPLSPVRNKFAVIAEQAATTRGKGSTLKGRDFRLDSVIYLDVNGKGRIRSVNVANDSYLMSEALVGGKKQVPNPDIDDIITGKRDRSITTEETLGAALRFFGAFGGVQSADDLDVLTKFVQPGTAVKFTGDPSILPFADKEIRTGKRAVVNSLADILNNSVPRIFDIQEVYAKGDRFIAKTFESRTAVQTGRNYDIPVLSIVLTATSRNGGKVASLESIFDSSIAATAFTGSYPFPVAA
ncbi:nuclear transport factor 2 family protein [Cyanobium sp. CH-040]|uniref:nuclear transport factor 2 family protein n=1 Tax=Cyanobium sp. CH-040 TaxID=2823708 RepID=UPI0020CD009E|nr:hypothetical protein [Cyanobium sp. CH-040]MCP9927041.1 hypothetical protein [Cyanobium sp. CH-040]